jgi:AhpD family alkylhydroperoxidase
MGPSAQEGVAAFSSAGGEYCGARAVAVSATNNCDYCLRSHSDALRGMGLDDEAIMELMAVVDFFNGSNAVASGLRIPYEPPVYAEQSGVVE